MPRTFFALGIPAAVSKLIDEFACRLALVDRSTRVTPLANFHLTLSYLGNCSPFEIERLSRIQFADLPMEFDLVVDRCGQWRRPGIVWLGPKRASPPLSQLVSRIRDSVDSADHDRPFRPHITLARGFRATAPEFDVSFSWKVTEFWLFHSVDGPRGVSYRRIQHWPLPGGASH